MDGTKKPHSANSKNISPNLNSFSPKTLAASFPSIDIFRLSGGSSLIVQKLYNPFNFLDIPELVGQNKIKCAFVPHAF